MPDFRSYLPGGILRFAGSRILRSLFTLFLFQLVLFGLIQALNASLPFDVQKFELAVRFQEDLSGFGSRASNQKESTPAGNTPAAATQSSSQELSAAPDVSGLSEGIGIEVGGAPGAGSASAGEATGEDGANPTAPPPATDIPAATPGKQPSRLQSSLLPWWNEFLGWMTAFYRGDFGKSNRSDGRPVLEILAHRLPRTLLLLIPGTLGGFFLGLWLGKVVAWQPRGWVEFGASLGGTAFYTSFPPWLAFVMISVFGLYLDWLPPEKLIDYNKWFMFDIALNDIIRYLLLTMAAVGLMYGVLSRLTRDLTHRKSILYRAVGGGGILLLACAAWWISGRGVLALDVVVHLILPVSTLMLLAFGETMLIMKTSMSRVVDSAHVRSARARGLPDPRVRDRHAARVAILPVLTQFVLHLPLIIIGSFVVEHFFFWDGMGQELIRAATENDIYVLMAILSLVAVVILAAHTVLDILIYWLDPRLRGGDRLSPSTGGK